MTRSLLARSEKKKYRVTGSSRSVRICRVPSEMVYSFCSVRSSRAPGNRLLVAILKPMKASSSTSSPVPEYMSLFILVLLASIGLLQVDDDRRGQQPGGHQRYEIQQVAQVQHALADGIEADQKTERGNGVQQPLGSPAAEQVEHQREAADDEH